MTDTQPPRHSASDIAVKSKGYTYMRHAMIIPTCVVQIYSWHIPTCSITGSICCWEWQWARDVGTFQVSGCKLFNNVFKVLNVRSCYGLCDTRVMQYLHSNFTLNVEWDNFYNHFTTQTTYYIPIFIFFTLVH